MTAELPDIGRPFLNRQQLKKLRQHGLYCSLLKKAGWNVDYIKAEENDGQSEDARIILTLPTGQAVIKTGMARILLQEDVLSDNAKLLQGWSVQENPDTSEHDTIIRYIGPIDRAYSVGVYALAGFVDVQ